MGVMTTKEVSHREEIVVCDKVENKEVGGQEKYNPYTKKTELWRAEDVRYISSFDLNKYFFALSIHLTQEL